MENKKPRRGLGPPLRCPAPPCPALALPVGFPSPAQPGWHAVTTRSVGSACSDGQTTCRPTAAPCDGMPPAEKMVGLAALDPPHIPKTVLRLSFLAVAAILFFGRTAATAREEPLPKALEKVGVSEHPGGQIPLDLPFVDSAGQSLTLRPFFDGRRPVLLTMNYSSCPMLCSLQLNGLFEGLATLPWNIGDRFQMVTVSIDPLETTERAAQSKNKYLKIYARPGSAPGWHWLTGRQEQIQKLADAVGFGFTYDKDSSQFVHPAVVMICTPDGRVSRYLYGVQFDPQTLRLSLVEAAAGKIGTTLDRVLLYCFHYDSKSGHYAPVAMRFMQVGALLTVLLLGAGLGLLWVRERWPRDKTKTRLPNPSSAA